MIAVSVNERRVRVKEGTTLDQMQARFMPEADVVIRNGHPTGDDTRLEDGDSVVFIVRGRAPSAKELSTLLAARHTPGVHARVKKAKVGIAGLGGLGSAVAVALARTGVGKLVLVDYDVVELSNLNRQQYFLEQLGQTKVEALTATLRRINPYVKAIGRAQKITADNAARLFKGCDIVAECLDGEEAKAMLIQALIEDKIIVAASGLAGYGPANAIVTRKRLNHLYLVGDGVSGAVPGTGLMAPLVGVAAHHQANAILRLIMGEEPCPR